MLGKTGGWEIGVGSYEVANYKFTASISSMSIGDNKGGGIDKNQGYGFVSYITSHFVVVENNAATFQVRAVIKINA